MNIHTKFLLVPSKKDSVYSWLLLLCYCYGKPYRNWRGNLVELVEELVDELVEQLMEELVEVVVLAHIAFELLMCPVRAFLPSPKNPIKKV